MMTKQSIYIGQRNSASSVFTWALMLMLLRLMLRLGLRAAALHRHRFSLVCRRIKLTLLVTPTSVTSRSRVVMPATLRLRLQPGWFKTIIHCFCLFLRFGRSCVDCACRAFFPA